MIGVELLPRPFQSRLFVSMTFIRSIDSHANTSSCTGCRAWHQLNTFERSVVSILLPWLSRSHHKCPVPIYSFTLIQVDKALLCTLVWNMPFLFTRINISFLMMHINLSLPYFLLTDWFIHYCFDSCLFIYHFDTPNAYS